MEYFRLIEAKVKAALHDSNIPGSLFLGLPVISSALTTIYVDQTKVKITCYKYVILIYIYSTGQKF